MKALRIGVVEDDVIIQDLIVSHLQSLGYETTEPALSYSEAINMLEKEKPDLLLLDINLMGKMDGIDVAKVAREKFNTPFIFLSANTDAATVERAKEVQPLTYLPKPFTKEVLYTTIEIAFSQLNTRNSATNNSIETNSHAQIPEQRFIFIKDGHQFKKVNLHDVLWIESEQNYLNIHLGGKKKLVARATLNDFLEQSAFTSFLRIHRSHAINLDKVESLDKSDVMIDGFKIAIAPANRDELMRRLGVA